ncbi:hypothetical protein PaG_01287 [Moesziomyces aphidis]|jgi:hypothetical protein|uniref:Secreted protein n=2 Tax=Moesziomyces TaxID=63261 RepID=M9MGS2_PSEA3|nr:hypothetical protein PaG_01287 [Moesziomyces aphidis]GAC75462.1 hypothetical protein PANT_15c00089 [Moesziomyces antarcticus T-34]
MKFATFSSLVVLLVAALSTTSTALPLIGGSQLGSATGSAGTAQSVQNNDYSHVSPGNQVQNGGSQKADLQGVAGNVLQGSGPLGLLH